LAGLRWTGADTDHGNFKDFPYKNRPAASPAVWHCQGVGRVVAAVNPFHIPINRTSHSCTAFIKSNGASRCQTPTRGQRRLSVSLDVNALCLITDVVFGRRVINGKRRVVDTEEQILLAETILPSEVILDVTVHHAHINHERSALCRIHHMTRKHNAGMSRPNGIAHSSPMPESSASSNS